MNPKEKLKAIEEVLTNFHRFKQHVRDKAKHDGMDVTHAQGMVLMTLCEMKQVAMSDLAKSLGMSGPAMTQFISTMEVKGLVQRIQDPGDKRRQVVFLCKDGSELLKKMKKQRIAHVAKLFEHLTEKEFEQYLTLHRKIFQSLH